MSTSRFFDWFAFAVLACWGLLGVSRAVLQRARGVRVVVADRQRTLGQMAVDGLAAVCLLAWAYEVIACAWSFDFLLGGGVLGRVAVDHLAIKIAGAAMVSAAVVIYAVAIRQLGDAWRLGVDRADPGPLVTRGVYGWSRHPIYVAFDLLFLGTFLTLGRLIFLLLAVVWIPLMHATTRREERFLTQVYGDAYRDYCRRVGRYGSWPTRVQMLMAALLFQGLSGVAGGWG